MQIGKPKKMKMSKRMQELGIDQKFLRNIEKREERKVSEEISSESDKEAVKNTDEVDNDFI